MAQNVKESESVFVIDYETIKKQHETEFLLDLNIQ
jgi:hypothetical protein